MDLGTKIRNFLTQAGRTVSSVGQSIGKAAAPLFAPRAPQPVSTPAPGFGQTLASRISNYFNPTSNRGQNFWSTPFIQKLGQVQSFIESPKQLIIIPEIKPPENAPFLSKAGAFLGNIPIGITNTISQGVTAPIMDIGQAIGRPLSGRQYDYNEFKNIGRLGLQFGGLLNKQAAETQGTKYGFKQVAGNVAETAMPIVTAATLKASPQIAGDVVQKAMKETFLQAIKSGAMSGVKYGGGFGLLSGLTTGRDIQNDNEYLANLGINTGAGALFGAGLGAVTAGAGYGFGAIKNFLTNALVKKHPEMSSTTAGTWIDGFFRHEDGRFASFVQGKTKIENKVRTRLGMKSNEPVYYGDLRESLGLPRNGDYEIPQIKLGLSTRALTKAEHEASLKLNNLKTPFDANSYIQEMTTNQKTAKIAGNPELTLKGKVGAFMSDFKQKFVDTNAPIEDALSYAEKQGNYKVLPTQDVRLQIDRVLRSKQIAGQFIKDNGLYDTIKSAPDINALDQYLIAKHAVENEAAGFATGRNLAKDKQLVTELAPTYEPLAQTVNGYSRKLLQYAVDNGLVSQAVADNLVKKYPNYVPLQRVFSELEGNQNIIGGRKGVASLSKQGAVVALKGSEREIANPTESLLVKTMDIMNQGERNVAAKQLASYRNLPGFQGLIRELGPKESAPHTFSYLDNGVKKTFETTPELEAAAKSLTPPDFGLLAKIFSIPTRVLQMGATALNIPFTLTNLAKDQMSAFINTNQVAKTSLINPVNFVRALYEAVGHGKLYQETIRNAGMGTSFDIARSAPETTIASIRSNRNVGLKIAYLVKNPEQLLRAVENVVGRTEELTRIQQYKGTYDALLAKGRTPEDATLLASQAARENTANFARSGQFGKVLNKVIPFFNAGIQGARQLDRSFQNNPAGTALKMAIGVFLPTAAVTAWNLSDPARKTVYEDISEFEKQNNIVIVPPNPTKDARGQWNVIKIPVSQEVAPLLSLVRRPIEASAGLDPVRFGEVATSLINATTSQDVSSLSKIESTFVPQALKPGLETITNKNLFTGKEIVPSEMRNLPPEEQKQSYTSQLAIDIGKRLNTSPLLVENFIKTSAAGVGSQLINAYDVAVGKGDKAGGENILQAVQRRFGKAQGGEIVAKANKLASKGMDKQSTIGYDYLHKGKTYDENGLPAQSGSLQDSMTNASVRLSSPEILAKEAAMARAQARTNGTPINPLYNLPVDQQLTVLRITSLPVKDPEKKTLTNANITWLKPYWDQQSQYISQMQAAGIFKPNTPVAGELQRPVASLEIQQAMDSKQWNYPGVQAYLDAYTLWANQERAKLGLGPASGAGGGSSGPFKPYMNLGFGLKANAKGKLASPVGNFKKAMAKLGKPAKVPKLAKLKLAGLQLKIPKVPKTLSYKMPKVKKGISAKKGLKLSLLKQTPIYRSRLMA